jgi:hypothetical protein
MNAGKAAPLLLFPLGIHPHLELDENRRELERERELERTIREARHEARERRRASRTGLLSRLRRTSPSKPRDLQGVIVEFQYGQEFEPTRIAAIAKEARKRFEALPGLRQKAFTVDEANRRAMNVYLWESEEPARRFLDADLVERVASLYGVRPTVSFVEVAELVENSA